MWHKTSLAWACAVGADRDSESFLALPEPEDTDLFIGMTTSDILKALERIELCPAHGLGRPFGT